VSDVSDLVVAGCGAGGVVGGLLLSVVIERVPARRSLVAAPYPEIVSAARRPDGVLIAIGTGALFAGLAARLGSSWALPAYFVLAAGLVALSAIDLRHYILPNRIVFPLAGVSIVLLGLAAAADDDPDSFLRALACGAGALLAFTALHVISPRAMGFGDVKLSFVLGLDLGWLGVGETLLGLFLGFVYGAVIGLVLIATRLRSRKDHVPFGPLLAAGALTAVLIGDVILDWYRG
jgi:leader peptidase (prepilin peptidase)/N-methyltransferase